MKKAAADDKAKHSTTARVTGIGGIFFRAEDPAKLGAWYEKQLGINSEHGFATFNWQPLDDPKTKGSTTWALFPQDTKYFGAGPQTFMINYRVENLDALLEALAREGVKIDPHRESYDYGRFAWIVDPEGNRIELWEPTKGK
jgi:predicted enzyme related to lactoylglutathione lyase